MDFCRVAVNYPGKEPLIYRYAPSSEEASLAEGALVELPLGTRRSKGCIVEFGHFKEEREELEKEFEIKSIGPEIDRDFQLSPRDLELYKWVARYYHYSLGALIFRSLPKILPRPTPTKAVVPTATIRGEGGAFPHALSAPQAQILSALEERLEGAEGEGGFQKFYLHGVTGSGKTLIYLHLIKRVLARGRSVLFLLPEINLTPQFIETFKTYLDCPILSYHSGLNNPKRGTVWRQLKKTSPPVLVLGVRSAVFLPLPSLGLAIVDEEHDASFKQNDHCPYNGRDVAIKKAQLAQAPILLGSATPALENFYSFAKKTPSHYFTLKERVGVGDLPRVEVLDARSSSFQGQDHPLWPLIPQSIEALKQALAKGEQALVLVNRLGHANFVQCRACGHRFLDPETQTNLRYFKSRGVLQSVHSTFQMPFPELCPQCGNMKLLQKGFGTEKIQEVLQKALPDERIDRFDRDEIKNIRQLQEKLNAFHSGEISIFVGTQMLAKGHNFQRVNTVLVLGIDQQLNFPDFRALERAYQLLTQITGRAGRFSPHARVLIQTLNPDIPLFDYVRSHSFEGFYEDELEFRHILQTPPFSRLAMLSFSSPKRERAVKAASWACELFKGQAPRVQVLGPSPAPVERKKSQYTWCVLLKSRSRDFQDLHHVLCAWEQNPRLKQWRVSSKVDVDPYYSL